MKLHNYISNCSKQQRRRKAFIIQESFSYHVPAASLANQVPQTLTLPMKDERERCMCVCERARVKHTNTHTSILCVV